MTFATTIRYWFNEFKRGRTFVFDEERPGRPIEVTTEDMVKKMHDIVSADRRVKIREIADIVDISTERIQNMLHEKLGMRKLSTFTVKTESHEQLRRTVWTCLSAIRKSFYGVS